MSSLENRREFVLDTLPPFILPFISSDNSVFDCKVISVPCDKSEEHTLYYVLCDFVVETREPFPFFNRYKNELACFKKKDGTYIFSFRNMLDYDEVLRHIGRQGELSKDYWRAALVGYARNEMLRPECQLSGFMDKIIDIKYTMLTSWEDNAIDAFLPVLEDYALSILLDRCDAARVFRVPIEAFHVLLSDLITFLLEDDDEDDSTESDGDE